MILVFFISELYSYNVIMLYIYIYQPSRYMLAMFSLVHDNEHKHNIIIIYKYQITRDKKIRRED